VLPSSGNKHAEELLYAVSALILLFFPEEGGCRFFRIVGKIIP
jgi:hypothetical protein